MTDDELALADAYACLRSILQTGQSYQIGDRIYTNANLREVRELIDSLSTRVNNANSTSGPIDIMARKGNW